MKTVCYLVHISCEDLCSCFKDDFCILSLNLLGDLVSSWIKMYDLSSSRSNLLIDIKEIELFSSK